MEAPILIRRSGDRAWQRATSINISRTGVLLHTHGLSLQLNTPVEILVALPVFGDLAASRIAGIGRIVRIQSSTTADDPVMAACLEEYRVLRDDEPAASIPTHSPASTETTDRSV